MLTVINKVDRTLDIPASSIKIEQVQGDPVGKFNFTLEDPGSQIQLMSQQEVIVFDENVVLTPNLTVPEPFSDAYLTDAVNTASEYTSTNNPGGSPATWTQNLQTGGGTTPLTTYLASTTSTTISTADKLYVASGTPTTVNTLVTCNGSLGWGEIVSKGSSSAWPASGSIGSPSGKGFFMDTTILDGLSIAAGNWSGNVRISANATGIVTANLTVRIYRYRPGTTTYALITSWTLSAQAWTTTISTAALPATAASAIAFAAGDKLYIDYWANITANTSGTGQQVRMNRLSTDTTGFTGDTNTQIVSPGYGAPVVTGSLTTSGGGAALYLPNGWIAQNATLSCTMSLSDFGGLACNVVDTSNFYELAVRDNSSPATGSFQLFKTVAGVRSTLGSSVGINFVRGTSHTITLSTSNSAGVTTLIATFDGVQMLSVTDSSSPLGRGQVGLRNDTSSGVSAATYTAFSALSNDVPTLVKSIPTHNYAKNNNFNFGSGGWSLSGSLSGLITFPANHTFGSGAKISMTFANAVLNQAAVYQFIPASYVVAGTTYCASGTFTVSSLVGVYAFIEATCYDVNLAVLADATTPITSSGRFSATVTAPAGTALILIGAGGQVTVGGSNSGTMSITALQMEPVWFPSLYSYPTPICDFLQSDSVTLPDGTTSRYDRIFTGTITHRKVTYGGTTRYWECEATALDGLLENVTLVNASYSSATDQYILVTLVNALSPRYLFANDSSLAPGTPAALAYRNVPVCVAGDVIDSIQYADATLREVLNSLMDLSGFLGGVDNYYNVYYYPPFYNSAPYGFSDNPDNVVTFPYYDYSIDYDGTQLQNDLKVSGANYQLQIVEAFAAQDGSHNEIVSSGKTVGFDLLHTCVGIPASVVFGGSRESIALDTNVGFGSSATLLQNGGTHIGIGITGLTAGTSISVTYIYSALVYVETKAPDSIAKYARPFYGKINDTNLASNASAVARGEAELEAYSDDRVTLTFKTWKMVTPGQIIEFTNTPDGLSKVHYVVQKVSVVFLGYDRVYGPLNEYQIEAGIYVDDFIDFFRNSQKAINRATHDPAAPIQQHNNLQLDSINITDSLTIHARYKPRVFGGPVPY